MNNDLPIHPHALEQIAAGAGQGSGEAYVPYIQVHKFKQSKGRRARVWSFKSKRTLHPLSWLEHAADVEADFDHRTKEILDQKMLPIPETKALAIKLKLQHPWFQGCLVPITTDLEIHRIDGSVLGLAVKYTGDLGDPLVGVSFEIAAAWYDMKGPGWSWKVATENEVNLVRAKNLILLRNAQDPAWLKLPPDKVERVRLYSEEALAGATSFADLAEQCEDDMGLPIGTVLQAYRHFIATRRWIVDLSKKFDPADFGECRKTLVLNLEETAHVPVTA